LEIKEEEKSTKKRFQRKKDRRERPGETRPKKRTTTRKKKLRENFRREADFGSLTTTVGKKRTWGVSSRKRSTSLREILIKSTVKSKLTEKTSGGSNCQEEKERKKTKKEQPGKSGEGGNPRGGGRLKKKGEL